MFKPENIKTKQMLDDARKTAKGIGEQNWMKDEFSFVRDKIDELDDLEVPKNQIKPWRTYRKDLRKWPQDVNFPDENFRPERPT